MLNLKRLHHFHAIAKAGGVNRAAERLHPTPQTLSTGAIRAAAGRDPLPARRPVHEADGHRAPALAYAEGIFQVCGELEAGLLGGAGELARHHGVKWIGQTDAIRERHFIVSTERHLSRPAVRMVSEIARARLFGH